MAGIAGAALVACALATAGCRTPQRPAPPPQPTSPEHELTRADPTAIPLDSGPPLLGPYLEQLPLGGLGRRKDLLATAPARSMHLLQLALPLPPHRHAARKTLAYVLTGRGTVRIGGREYPAAPGAAFRIDAGVAHSILPDDGETIVAIIYHEPPLVDGDDSEPVR